MYSKYICIRARVCVPATKILFSLSLDFSVWFFFPFHTPSNFKLKLQRYDYTE